MPYKGPSVICRFCGRSFTRPASLARHLNAGRCPRQKPAATVSARRKKARAKILDVTPSRCEIVRSVSETASISPAVRETRIVPASSGTLHQTRIEPKLLNPFESVARGELTGLEAFDAELLTREKRAALSLSRPDEKATLWSQYYALKALAVRLDSGCATARERAVFEAGLREYNANFERVRACTSLSVE